VLWAGSAEGGRVWGWRGDSLRVLIVEDDLALAASVRRGLEREGYDVALAGTGRGALDLVRSWNPDVVLLDLKLPDADGRDVARRIRTTSDVPLIIVTGRGGETELVAGLEVGADDYLVKPVSFPELIARLRAVTRRARDLSLDTQRLTHLDLSLDLDRHRAFRGEREVGLTHKEFEILRMLMERPGRLVRRGELAQAIWGLPASEAAKVMSVHLSSLRRKLGDDPRNPRYIETLRGVGFRLVES